MFNKINGQFYLVFILKKNEIDVFKSHCQHWNLGGRQITMGQFFRILHTKIGYKTQFQSSMTN